MNRLQKKCVIATAGFHLLLLVILLSARPFSRRGKRPDDTQLLDVIPANLVDARSTAAFKSPAARARAGCSAAAAAHDHRIRNQAACAAHNPTPTLVKKWRNF